MNAIRFGLLLIVFNGARLPFEERGSKFLIAWSLKFLAFKKTWQYKVFFKVVFFFFFWKVLLYFDNICIIVEFL